MWISENCWVLIVVKKVSFCVLAIMNVEKHDIVCSIETMHIILLTSTVTALRPFYSKHIAFTLRCWFSLASIALSYQLFNISNLLLW